MTEEIKDEQQERIEALLGEYDEHRIAIKDMISQMEDLRANIEKLFPQKLDARFVRFFEEKIKTMTALFNSLLEMRKEVTKSVKDEIEIRRRIKTDDELIDIEDMLDVRSMASKIDKFKHDAEKLQQGRLEVIRNQTIDEGIEVPGLTDEKGRKIQQ